MPRRPARPPTTEIHATAPGATPPGTATAGAAAAESLLRLLAQRSRDVVYRYRLKPEPLLEYISPGAEWMTGYPPEAFQDDPDLWTRLVHPDDRAQVEEAVRADPEAPVVARWVRRDGSMLWAEDRRVLVTGPDGAIVAVEGMARDVTLQVEAERRLRASELRFHDFLSSIELAALMLDAEGRVEFINDHLLALLGRKRRELLHQDWIDLAVPERERAALREILGEAISTGSGAGRREDTVVTRSGEERRLVWTSVIQQDAEGRPAGIAAIAYDVTDVHRLEADRALLASAVEQSAESVIITDRDARITYVNRAFEQLSGYSSGEVIGRNPSILGSGLQSRAFYEAMWAALSNGLPWVAELTNRRKDGTLYQVSAVISPIRGSDGSISGFVADNRDVSHERELESRTELLTRERALITETIRTLPFGGILETTAELFCRQVASLTDVAVSCLMMFDVDGSAIPLAYLAPGGPDVGLRRLPAPRSRYLYEHAAAGPWVESWTGDTAHPYAESILTVGARAFAYAPVQRDGILVGLLAVGSAERDAVTQLSGQLGAIVDFADLAGAILGPRLVDRRDRSHLRAEVEGVIAERAFIPVYQPIVDLLHRRIVAYEALTRFTDQVTPDVRFADAATVGLGIELEAATLEAALRSATDLPGGRWLHLNVSPAFVLSEYDLPRLLGTSRRRVVLEVTEHAAIDDYLAFRDAIERIGRPVQLAVDDAGAGFASLRHILELRPAFVKLDISLVRGLDGDPARQALVAGMRHFVRHTHRRLIAEGVETEAEAAMLRTLEIRLAQGYLLGRPAPIQAHSKLDPAPSTATNGS